LSAIALTTAEWPVVVSTFDGAQTTDELRAYLAAFDEGVYARRQPFVHLVFMKQFANRYEHLQMVGAWGKAVAEVAHKYCLGVAIVSDSPLVRTMLNLIFLIQPNPAPLRVCRTREEALGYIRALARKAELPLPEALNVA
jgi:hypothetical protein